MARFAERARELRDVNVRGRVRAAFDPILAALPGIGVLIVLAVGVYRVESGATDPGDVVTVAYLLTIVSFPIRSIGWLLGEFPRSVVGYRRVSRCWTPPERCSSATSRSAAGRFGARLLVDGLAYSYDPDQVLLDDVTFEVAPGRTVAVVKTASGKSTLTTLMTRLVDPDGGRILLDGIDLRDLAREAGLVGERRATGLRSSSTTPWQQHDAGRRVDHRRRGVGVARAAKPTASLPPCPGLDARLGERGTSLSGGQRQRILWRRRWYAARGC